MKITTRKPYGYSRIGRKDNQEDNVYPLFDSVNQSNKCFVLCDGVGGSARGEVASRCVCDTIGKYFDELLHTKSVIDISDMNEAVSKAYTALDTVDVGESMATTLTCVCINDAGVIVSHMGDSRIYQIRPGVGIMYQSSDHSLVNSMLQAGEISPEEARNYKKKNVITRALQPHSEKFEAETYLLTDILPGDYFFLCCDGVLECLTNERLQEILSMHIPDKEKCSLLEMESMDKTKDNFTAYLIPIDNVVGGYIAKGDDIDVEVESEPQDTAIRAETAGIAEANEHTNDVRNKLMVAIIVCLCCFISIGGILFAIHMKSKKEPVNHKPAIEMHNKRDNHKSIPQKRKIHKTYILRGQKIILPVAYIISQ